MTFFKANDGDIMLDLVAQPGQSYFIPVFDLI